MALTTVLDTNILLVSISSRSPHHWLFQALARERFDLLVTHDILLEYEEIIARDTSFPFVRVLTLKEFRDVLEKQ